jgi:hypothetical protein
MIDIAENEAMQLLARVKESYPSATAAQLETSIKTAVRLWTDHRVDLFRAARPRTSAGTI